MKRFLLFLVGILIAFTSMNAETYTHKFRKGELTTEGGTFTLSEVVWTASNANNISWNDDRGIQFGGKSGVCAEYSLKTSAFADYIIKSIAVETSCAGGSDAKMTITVGNATSGSQAVGTETSSVYTYICGEKGAQGDITIGWTASEKKAYYVKSITIEYTIPTGMLDIEEPTFKTIPGVYVAKDTVTVETADASLVLYYTLDGSTPTYEGFNNKSDSTKCSKYNVIYHELTESIVMKVIAVKTDGDIVYQSDVVEANYIVSPVKPYTPAKEIKTGCKYAFVANDTVVADFLFGEESGELKSRNIASKHDKYIETIEYNAFTFTSTNGGYTVQDAEERYMYITDGKLSFSKEMPATGGIWVADIDNGKAVITNGNKALYYSKENRCFSCSSEATSDLVLPAAYTLRDYPKYIITPANNSEIDELLNITITCNEGIKASDDLKVVATDGYNFNASFTCKQVHADTLVFAMKEPLKTENNTYLWINMTGKITLCPDELDMKLPVTERYGASTIVNYKLNGYAPPATIEKITPANGAKVKELSYILFTFSYYADKTGNTEISPKLHMKGSDEMIPVEFTTDSETGTGKVELLQCALKVTNPVKKNGTYILEIPDGYFVDGNGKDIKGIRLEYIVENDGTGIADVIAEGENYWIVYDLAGTMILETSDAGKLMALPRGLYIVNGTKRIIR